MTSAARSVRGRCNRSSLVHSPAIGDGLDVVVVEIGEPQTGFVQRGTHAGLVQHEPAIAPVALSFGDRDFGSIEFAKGLGRGEDDLRVRVDVGDAGRSLNQVGFEQYTFVADCRTRDAELIQGRQ